MVQLFPVAWEATKAIVLFVIISLFFLIFACKKQLGLATNIGSDTHVKTAQIWDVALNRKLQL